ncbi:hypothetical protein N9K90_02655 [Gammaproteobacteria bacterium]|nr:hypothetical protein [Gammaproteobacteria bacterium]
MKKIYMYIIMLPLLLSSEQLLATDNSITTSADHTGSSGHSQSATDYNESGAGASVTNRLNSSTSPLGSGSRDGSADLELDVYTDGAGYADARATISAGIDSNANCAPCGATIELSEIKYSDSEALSQIIHNADEHYFAGKVSVFNGNVGFTDVAGSIEANLQAAATNTTEVASNKTNIATNTTGIATNKTNIATNTTNIATNTTGIATNKTNIATNTTNIATNTTGIATNKTNIATNTTNIATNKIDIAANTSLIATNTATLSALIGINGVGIQSLASSFSSFQEDTNRNFIALTGNMYEGLAEVTAISNVAYASSGWRASAGYGDYKSKSATAVGISYAGEKYKFKFSKSGDATGFGISYDF